MEAPLRAVAFDFSSKSDRPIQSQDVGRAIAAGQFVWIDIDLGDEASPAALRDLGLVSPTVVDRALATDPVVQQARYEDCLHLTFSAPPPDQSHFTPQRVDAVIGRGFLLTLHRGAVPFIEEVRREYRADFVQHARTPSFLVYELCDHLLDAYATMQNALEARVRAMQAELMRHVDDEVFARVSELGALLLRFRGVLVPTRSVIAELSSRRSEFVSEATQPFLANMVGTLDHLLQDVTVDREVLSEALNLQMSMLTHRTNQVVTRLTALSVIFMPLTFLCGIWGMNFTHMPEIDWPYGYALFWVLVAVLVAAELWFLRRKKWL